jgi:hypothetical protein
MFSYRLARLPYAVLMCVHAFWVANQLALEEPEEALLAGASLPFLFIFVIWPRLRDCNWPLWFGFLLLIPLAGHLIGLALLFAPSKILGRREQAANVSPDDGVPPQIAGSLCARCGMKIILASEGVAQGPEVFCKSCDETPPEAAIVRSATLGLLLTGGPLCCSSLARWTRRRKQRAPSSAIASSPLSP